MSLSVIIAVFTAFTIPEVVLLRKGKQKELIIFSAFMLTAFILSILIIQDVKIPSMKAFFGDFILSITGE